MAAACTFVDHRYNGYTCKCQSAQRSDETVFPVGLFFYKVQIKHLLINSQNSGVELLYEMYWVQDVFSSVTLVIPMKA